MLKGEKVTLRPMERDDLKRLHEMRQDVELVILAFGDWQPRPLARFEKDFDKHLERDEVTWFVIEADGKSLATPACTAWIGGTARRNWASASMTASTWAKATGATPSASCSSGRLRCRTGGESG